MSRYASHCGRKIVSLKWNHCPYCGEALWDIIADEIKTEMKRPDGSKRVSPLASKKPVTAEIHTVTLAERDARCLSAGRNKNKGKKCFKPKGHRGKHAYYEALFDF